MVTTRTWTMSVIQMLRSRVALFLTVASCVAGAPLQIEGENIGLGQAVYSQPEMAEALARTYEALEWQERTRENHDATRNLDHIGGGNLLRTLDHIGGGNLLRDLDIEIKEQSQTGRNDHSIDHLGGSDLLDFFIVDNNREQLKRTLDHIGGGNLLRDLDFEAVASSRQVRSEPLQNNPNITMVISELASGFKDDPSSWPANRGTLDHIGGGHLIGRIGARNLDHIGGGNLLRDLENANLDSSSRVPHQRNLDHIGGGNLLRDLESSNSDDSLRRVPLQRNSDRIGDGNSLRDLESSKQGESEQSTGERVQIFKQNPRPNGANAFLEGSSRWSPLRKNLDHIGGGNLLRNVDNSELARSEYLTQQRIQSAERTPSSNIPNAFLEGSSRWSPLRKNLDHIGGGNLLRNVDNSEPARSEQLTEERVVQSAEQNPNSNIVRFLDESSGLVPHQRNLDHIGGGNLLRKDVNEVYKLERNLDHIGGGNLLRKYVDELSEFKRNLDHIGGGNLLRKDVAEVNGFQRNLDHIGGGNLLRNLDIESYVRSTTPRSRNSHGTLDSIGGGDLIEREPEVRGLNAISGGHLLRQSRRGLDSLSGATFGESKRWNPARKQNEPTTQNGNWPNIMNRMQFDSSAKRNFDEIDRTNFDSFVKRNLDEIDRTGWDSFVKRRSMNAYLASRQR